MYSPRVMKRIKSMIKGKQAYIVPGIISSDDIKLSIRFNIPMMCGEPQKWRHLIRCVISQIHESPPS